MSRITGGVGLPAGVAAHPRSGKFQARIKRDGKRESLGYFATPQEAHAAYIAAGGRVALEVTATPREAKHPGRGSGAAARASASSAFKPRAHGLLDKLQAKARAIPAAQQTPETRLPTVALGWAQGGVFVTEQDALYPAIKALVGLAVSGLIDVEPTRQGYEAAAQVLQQAGALALVTDSHAHALGQYVPRLRAEEFAQLLASTADLV